MTFVPDETLMAYADDLLPADDRRRLDARLANDQALRARLEPFLQTGPGLARLFERPMREPVPPRLIAAVDAALAAGRSAEARGAQRRNSGLSDLIGWVRTSLFEGDMRFATPAIALGVIGLIVVGAISGLILGTASGPSNVVLADAGGLYASPALAKALDTTSSSSVATLDGAVGVVPVLSFRNKNHQLCRTFVVMTGEAHDVAAVACKSVDAGWRIPLQAEVAAMPTQSGGKSYEVADGQGSRSPAIEGFLDEAIEGSPLSADQEAGAIAAGWIGTTP